MTEQSLIKLTPKLIKDFHEMLISWILNKRPQDLKHIHTITLFQKEYCSGNPSEPVHTVDLRFERGTDPFKVTCKQLNLELDLTPE